MAGPLAPVFKFYVVPEKVPESGDIKAKGKMYTMLKGYFISGNIKRTSNFITHLKRVHDNAYTELKQLPFKNPQASQPSVESIWKKQDTKRKYASSDARQLQITDALVTFIANDLLPLSLVESPDFRNLIEICDSKYQMPSRKHFSSKILKEKARETQTNLKHKLSMANSVCLTTDLWSNRQMSSFLGITGHFIIDWTYKSVLIGCRKFQGHHTAENIRQAYEEAISCLDIAEKITNIVTDNAANMKKAFKVDLPGYYDKESKDLVEAATSLDEDDFDDSQDEDDDDEQIDKACLESLPAHSPCYAHTLQLVVRDGLNAAPSHMKTLISKASLIVSHVRKSIHASELLNSEKRLQAQNATRWNSQLHMIKSILNIPEEKLNSINYSQKLSAYEKKILHELCNILEPFETATDMIQKGNFVTASLAIPVTLELKLRVKQTLSLYNNKMVTTLKDSCEKRLSVFETNENFIIATCLDPRFKMEWVKPENMNYVESRIKGKVEELSDILVSEKDDSASPPRKRAKVGFFQFKTPQKDKKRHNSGIQNELAEYLQEESAEDDKCPLKYWETNDKKFPKLARLAQKYLAIPASSALVERVFSIAGKIFSPTRTRLNPATFELLMNIKCNSKI